MTGIEQAGGLPDGLNSTSDVISTPADSISIEDESKPEMLIGKMRGKIAALKEALGGVDLNDRDQQIIQRFEELDWDGLCHRPEAAAIVWSLIEEMSQGILRTNEVAKGLTNKRKYLEVCIISAEIAVGKEWGEAAHACIALNELELKRVEAEVKEEGFSAFLRACDFFQTPIPQFDSQQYLSLASDIEQYVAEISSNASTKYLFEQIDSAQVKYGWELGTMRGFLYPEEKITNP